MSNSNDFRIGELWKDENIIDPNTDKHPIAWFLDNGKIEYGKWYWVQEDPYVNITGIIFHEGHPLYERHKARVVDMHYYIENQKDPNIHGLFKINAFIAYMFTEAGPTGNKAPSLERTVAIVRTLSPTFLEADIIKSMKLDDRQSGSYFFKNTPVGLTEINYDDLYFLRNYYQVDIEQNETGDKNIKIQESNITKLGYSIFEYYPSGALNKITQVGATLITDDSAKKKYPHGYKVCFRTTEYRDDFKMPTRLSKKITELQPVTDVKHPYWIPNILHD